MAPERQGADEIRKPRPVAGSNSEEPGTGRQQQQRGRPEDDDLTNLTWLQDSNLLQSIRPTPGAGRATGGEGSAPPDGEGEDVDRSSTEEDSGGTMAASPGESYDPAIHVRAKPPYSFSSLIFMAVEDSPTRALPVKEIYGWILSHFPYFQTAPTGWKNSVRHNLSLNKCFLKVDKGQNVAKGSLWCIDPEYRPNLLLALRKTPPNPFHPMRMPEDVPSLPPSSLSAFCLTMCSPTNKTLPALTSPGTSNLPNPDLFPYLSKRLAPLTAKDLEVDAAATMLALKSAPRILVGSTSSASGESQESTTCGGIVLPTKERRQKRVHNRTRVLHCYPHLVPPVYVPVITVGPSEDHTYSSTYSDSPGSSIDEPFEFGRRRRRLADTPGRVDDPAEGDSGGDSGVTRSGDTSTGDEMEDLPYDDGSGSEGEAGRAEREEQKKIVEGAADALLNLAGIRTERGTFLHHYGGASRTRGRRKDGQWTATRPESVVQR